MIAFEKIVIGVILFSAVAICLGTLVSLWVELGFGLVCLFLWYLYVRTWD